MTYRRKNLNEHLDNGNLSKRKLALDDGVSPFNDPAPQAVMYATMDG